ncbi:MAG: hypothetical protein A4E19_02305 [Nitrospira sp. SG-bin1]|nr:MAG: hypothetical protein A4E19_02305 [Nitrospira sp. SG-bin1]
MIIIRAHHITVFFLWLLISFWCDSALAKSTLLSDLYYTSYMSPETTDEFIRENKRLFDKPFMKCLYGWRQKVMVKAGQEGKFCTLLPDEQYSDCVKNNYTLGVYFWTLAIEEAIKGTAWEETEVGAVAVRSKGACDFYDVILKGLGRTCEEMSEEMIKNISKMLICS